MTPLAETTAAIARTAPSDVALFGHVMTMGAWGLILIGLYAMVAERDLVRIILGLVLIGSGVNLFLVAVGFRPDAAAPILEGAMSAVPMVDPIPQALVLTSIVIDVGVLALALALAIKVYEAYGTLDTREVQRQIAVASATGGAGDGGRPGQPASTMPAPANRASDKRALEDLSS